MTDSTFAVSGEPTHWALSALLLLLWLLASWRWLRKMPLEGATEAHWLIIHASQTGQAQDLAKTAFRRVSKVLEAQGRTARLAAANVVTKSDLARAEALCFVVATTGEGEAPDNALRFEREVMASAPDLTGKLAAILALGDRRYDQFCAFGQRVAEWLEHNRATFLGPPVLVDDHAPADLERWDALLRETGFPEAEQDSDASVKSWKVVRREQVAKASPGSGSGQTSDGLYHLVLQPQDHDERQWQIGDLFELHTPCGHLRDYSIANRPGSEELHLIVRRVLDQGRTGRGSGLLTATSEQNQVVNGRIRPHPSFRPPAGDGPLLAIGAGSGWAGLRPHVLHAMANDRPCWLIYGERQDADNDALLAEMRAWHREGQLLHLDLALSSGGGPYVQDIVAQKAAQLVQLCGPDTGVILCGRLAMGQACLAELARMLSQDWLDEARETGRLRHDLY
ncbi:NADPH cytochrome P450 oxidoreductase family protein [Aurantiacibacter flavus]|uniref:NADPH--hemoprotein reductase n=1 Tax=Aurantiacibacter flavus TaxID=3145232 RepID=A0ABV0CY81_9SPHN